MWADEAVPRLQALGLGAPVATRTYRLAGIGESQVAELLGEAMLRATNPIVATYARVEAVDVRISAVAVETMSAEALVEDGGRASSRPSSASYVWATGETTWSDAIGARPRRARLDARGRRDRHRREHRGVVRRRARGCASTNRSPPRPRPRPPTSPADGPDDRPTDAPDAADEAATDDLIRYARRARELGGADVGLAVRTPAAQRRHGGVDRGRGARPASARPARRVPDRWDGTLASGPRRGRGPARARSARPAA